MMITLENFSHTRTLHIHTYENVAHAKALRATRTLDKESTYKINSGKAFNKKPDFIKNHVLGQRKRMRIHVLPP